jgi:methionyl-tRNA formyltransferase
VSTGLRVVVASYGAVQFRLLRQALTDAGHVPVAYLVSRSMRPATAPEPDIFAALTEVISDLPPGMDLLLPGTPGAVAEMISGYAPDILLVFGFNWRLPREVLAMPRLGALNVHPAPLPKYRGPSPVLWAIRNGDPYLGLTIHRMTGRIDSGPVLAQVSDIPLPDRVTREDAWDLQMAALPGVLATALDRAVRGEPGTPQDERAASYAGFPPAEWYEITWDAGRCDVHNQIRLLRYLKRRGPVVTLQGHRVRIEESSLTDNGSLRVDCADGPLWITTSPAESA